MEFEQHLRKIEELSKTARTIWFLLIVVLLFCLYTLIYIKDEHFFGFGRAIRIPSIIAMDMPTDAFFIVLPTVIWAIYVYMHVYLLNLWQAVYRSSAESSGLVAQWLGDPPPRTDTAHKARVGEAFYPSILLEAMLGKAYFENRDFLRIKLIYALLSRWIVTPVILGLFWVRSWAYHHEWTTLFILFLLLTAIWVGACSYGRARDWIAHDGKTSYDGPAGFVRYAYPWVIGFAAIALGVLSWQKTEGILHPPSWGAMSAMHETDLRKAVFVRKPADWQSYEHAWSDYVRKHRRNAKEEILLGRIDVDDTSTIQTAYRSTVSEAEIRTYLEPGFIMKRGSTVQGLSKKTLEDADLRYADLEKASLLGLDLTRVRMSFATLTGAELEWADLSDTTLEHVDFANARMEGALFSKATINHSDFTGARMRHADMSDAIIDSVLFRGAVLDSIRFRDARLNHANFTSLNVANGKLTDLQNSVFDVSRMTQVSFAGSKMARASFRNAYVEGGNFFSSRLAGADFSYSDLKGTDLSQAQLPEAAFEGVDIIGVLFRVANMPEVNFRNATMRDADFSIAQMPGADFRGAEFLGTTTLRGANLRKADLTGAQFIGIDLNRAKLNRAILQGALLQRANLSRAMLENVDLREARLDGANLWRTRLSGAQTDYASVVGVDLRTVEGLTRAQLQVMYGDNSTRLPPEMEPYRPGHWASQEVSMDDATDYWHRWRDMRPGLQIISSRQQ